MVILIKSWLVDRNTESKLRRGRALPSNRSKIIEYFRSWVNIEFEAVGYIKSQVPDFDRD